MGKTNFNSIQELTEYIQSQIENLSKGKLTVKEIEEITDASRDLYERCVVIRHKAYEKFGKEEVKEEKPLETPKKEEIKPTYTESKAETEVKEEPAEELLSFDFSDSFISETTPENPVEKSSINIDVKQEKFIDEKSGDEIKVTKTEVKSINESIQVSNSLNDSLKSNSNSLGDKLKKTPISDLKTHIGMNHKFIFINELFGGKNDEYNQAIDALNSCTNIDDARNKLGEYSEKLNWDVEKDSVVNFVETVERRYV